MRQTKAIPDLERKEQSLVKAAPERLITDGREKEEQIPEDRTSLPKKEEQTPEDRTSLQRRPYTYGSQAIQNRHLNEALPSDARLALLREWGSLIYRYKLLIIAVIVIVLPYVIVDAYRDKPIYQATATIEVRKEGSSLKPNDIFYSEGAYDNTKAEAFMIRSRPVIEKTVVNLKLNKNPSFLDVNSRRSTWEAIAALKGSEVTQVQKGDQAAQAQSPAAEVKSGDKPETKEIGKFTADERGQLAPYIQTLIGNLKVDGVRDTRLLKISFTHTDPGFAALVSNGVAQNFIEYSFQNKTKHIDDASSWLEESTNKLKARVTAAEQTLANYSRENNIISVEGKENLTTEKLVRMHDQVLRAETDRILKQSLYDQVKQGRIAQLPEAFADQKTADLKRALNELAVMASQLSVRFGAKHPKLLEIRQQMATIQEQLDANRTTLEGKLKADYERAERDERSLKAALSRAKSEAVQQNQASIKYRVLQQDLDTAKALYTDFLNKTSQVSIQRAEQYNNVRLVEAAEYPSGAIGPNRMTKIMIWFVLSLALGIAVAWLIENLNTKIRTVEDVSRSLEIPVLAAIPTLSDDFLATIRNGLHEFRDGRDSALQGLDRPAKPITLDMLRESSVADEAYRMLRTSVLLSTAGRPPRTILFVSPQPGDGKTTTVINTAIAFTHLKSEILIIDCDMRKPNIHKLARLDREKGLSTYLSRGGDITEFIKRTPIPCLSILPCGPVPQNPSELISSENMRKMLNSLTKLYDYIIIDSPPLVGVTDPIILSTIVDGVILVAKSGKSKSEVLRRALQDLLTVRARVLGIVVNGLHVSAETYNYYHFTKYYRSDYSSQVQSESAGN